VRPLSQTHQHPRLDHLLMKSAFIVRVKVTGRRNCKLYLESLKKDSGKGTTIAHTLVVYITNIFLANSYINSWLFDTRSVAHICNTMQEMIRSRSVGKGEVDFHVGKSCCVECQDDVTPPAIRIYFGIE
jgi:hypothetical protein